MSYEIKEGLNYIEHKNGKRLTYRFTPATFSKGAPILVIFSAWGTKIPSKFNDAKWNVISFVDTFGIDGNGCGYLGERGNFFVRDMINSLIESAIKTCACVPQENLFIYASSIASMGAIRYAIMFEANAIYLNAPIIQSKDTTLCKVTRKENFDFPFDPDNRDVIESDMVKFLKAHKDKNLPTFFIVDSMHQSEDWLQNFLEEHTLYFANACKEEGADVHLELIDTEGHKIHHTTREIITLFEKYTPPKYLDIMKLTTSLDNNSLKINCALGKDYPVTGDEQYAFYLMYKGERIQVISYTEETEVLFKLEGGMNPEYIEVIGFIKGKDGKVIKDKASPLV